MIMKKFKFVHSDFSESLSREQLKMILEAVADLNIQAPLKIVLAFLAGIVHKSGKVVGTRLVMATNT